MEQQFEIFVDQLRGGKVEKIDCLYSADCIEVDEKELSYSGDVKVDGEAYVTDDSLLLNLKIKTKALMPCSICNEPCKIEIDIPNFYHVESLDQIKGAVFDFSGVLRESIVLETPHFVECHGGKCPKRDEVGKYLREDEGYRPFADLM